MTEYKLTEMEKAIQISLEQAVKEFDSISSSNREEILQRGYEIIQTYRFVVDENIKFDETTGEQKTEKVYKKFNKMISESNVLSGWNTYKRLADFSKLPIKNPFFHRPNKNKFVKACKELFPNVDAFNVGACLTNFRKVIENIYFNLGFEGLKPQQVCFYQFSALGGTGKSEFRDHLKEFLEKYNLPNADVYPEGRWVGSEFSSNIVGFVNEFFPLRGTDADNAIRTLNNIIDNTEYRVEYKGQDSFFNHSRITLFVNSNKIPFDSNTRRYGIVRYNEAPFASISAENKKKYFAERDWNKLFLEAFESCPFGETFEDIECKNSETLNDLIFAARDYVNNAGPSLLTEIQNMSIRQFVNNYLNWKNDFGKIDTKFLREKIWQFTESIRKAVATGEIKPSQRINGRIEYSRYNWQEISNMKTSEDDLQNNLNNIDNMFERTKAAFDNFLEPEEPTNPDPKDRQTKLSDGWLFEDYYLDEKDLNEKGEPKKKFCDRSFTNEGQKQVCVNKPLVEGNLSRCNEDVEQGNFLFEIDPPKYEESLACKLYDIPEDEYYAEELEKIYKKIKEFGAQFAKSILWVCYSGKKSIHVVLKTNCNNIKYREYIFDFLNNKYWEGKCDKQCKNAGRLARNPNAVRENGKRQTTFVINENAEALDVTQLMREYDEKEERNHKIAEELKKHLKKWEGQDKRTPLEKLKCIVTKTQKPSGLLALSILENGGCSSGENMIGAIGYLETLGKTIDPVFQELAEECRQICHNQHPSNIGKK